MSVRVAVSAIKPETAGGNARLPPRRRRIPTLQVAGGRARKAGINPPASWLDGAVTKAAMMDPNTAQVTPLELTTKLMDAAVAAGARVQIGAPRQDTGRADLRALAMWGGSQNRRASPPQAPWRGSAPRRLGRGGGSPAWWSTGRRSRRRRRARCRAPRTHRRRCPCDTHRLTQASL